MKNDRPDARQRQKKRKRRGGVLVLLLLFFLGTSGGGWWLASSRGTATERVLEERRLVPDFEPAAIAAVTISGDGVESVALAKDDRGAWMLTIATPTPSTMAADPGAVEELLARLHRAEVVPAANRGDDAALGLAPPRNTVTLTRGDGAAVTLELGAEAVTSGRFVRRAGQDEVMVIAADLATALARPAPAYRSRALFGVPAGSVTQLEVLAPSHTLVLAREGDGYRLSEPLGARAHPRRAAELLTLVGGARVAEWLVDDPGVAVTGLDDPQVRVRVAADGEPGAWIDIGRAARPGLKYARRESLVGLVEDELAVELLRDPARLVDRDLLDVPYDRAQTLEIRGRASGTWRAMRDAGGAWTLETTPDGGAPYLLGAEEIRQLLVRLDRAEGLTAAEAPAGEADLVVRVAEGDQADADLELWAPASPGADAVARAGSLVTTVEERLYRLLADPGSSLRARQVFAPIADPDAVGFTLVITRDRPDATRERVDLVRPRGAGAGGWRTSAGGTVRAHVAEAMFQELLHLEAREFLPPGSGRVSAPERVEIVLEPEAGAPEGLTVRHLEILGPASGFPGLFLARSPEHPQDLLLGEAARERFRASLE